MRPRGGHPPWRVDSVDPLHLQRPAGRPLPLRADPGGGRCGTSVSVRRRGSQRGLARRGQPGLEAGSRDSRVGSGRPAGHLSRRAPPGRRSDLVAHPGPGGPAARTGSGRRRTSGGVLRATRRRTGAAPHRRLHRRHRHPLPDARQPLPPVGGYVRAERSTWTCASRVPSSSTWPTAPTSAKPPGAGPIDWTSTPTQRAIARPTPSSSVQTPTSPGQQRSMSPPIPSVPALQERARPLVRRRHDE